MDAQRFGPVDAAALVKRLQRPAHPVDVVLDTDAVPTIHGVNKFDEAFEFLK